MDDDPGSPASRTLVREFDDNGLLHMLFGPGNAHLARIERRTGIRLASRGNTLSLSGAPDAVEMASLALDDLYRRLRDGQPVDLADVDAALRMTGFDGERIVFVTRKRRIHPQTPGQAVYMEAMERHELTFGVGPAGTGKTYLAVAKGVAMMQAGEVDRIILSRPAVEAGERLGFLPGDLREKVDPYLRPLYDALHDMMPSDQVARRLAAGDIEVAPLAFMRGRTLGNAFVILDEAQNTTPAQMKMFLTRLGEHARMVVTGDLSQVDLPAGVTSGLKDALEVLAGVPNVGVVTFTDRDVVRHALVADIVAAYDAADAKRRETGR